MNTKTIDLQALCEVHKSPHTHRSNKLILEDIFAVCTNADFLETVQETRKYIESEYATKLPFSGTFRDTSKSVEGIRKKIYDTPNGWNEYQKILSDIRQKHTLNGEAWHYDPFTRENMKGEIESNVEALEEMYKQDFENDRENMPTKEELQAKAEKEFYELAFQGHLSCLESIIFVNDPYENTSHMGIPHGDRGGFLHIEKEFLNPSMWVITGKFYLHSTKQDMIRAIEHQYDEIDAKRKRMFGFEPKKPIPKQDLSKIYEVYKLNAQGETPVAISNILEKKKREDDPEAETMIDEVKKILERIKKESKKHDSKYRDK